MSERILVSEVAEFPHLHLARIIVILANSVIIFSKIQATEGGGVLTIWRRDTSSSHQNSFVEDFRSEPKKNLH